MDSVIKRDVSNSQHQIDSLDGLRGVAALIVVSSHTSNAGMFFLPFLDLGGSGKSGVFLFFLLSSFLLTLPLLRAGKNVLTLSVMSHYWQRRFFRIFPLYALYLLMGVVTTWAFATTIGRNGFGIPFALDWVGFVKHLALLEGKGVTWSIVVEFKFYFILPIMVSAIIVIRSLGFAATILLFFVLLASTQLLSPQSESQPNDARLLPYMPIFTMGIFLAVLQDHLNQRKLNKVELLICRWLGYLGIVGVVLMIPKVFSLLGERVPNNYFHKEFVLYAFFWSLILLSSVNVNGAIQRLLSLSILRFFGALSFSLYLLHPIFIFAFTKVGMNGYLSAWGVLILSTAAAYASFNAVELPASKWKLNQGSRLSMAEFAKHFERKK